MKNNMQTIIYAEAISAIEAIEQVRAGHFTFSKAEAEQWHLDAYDEASKPFQITIEAINVTEPLTERGETK